MRQFFTVNTGLQVAKLLHFLQPPFDLREIFARFKKAYKAGQNL